MQSKEPPKSSSVDRTAPRINNNLLSGVSRWWPPKVLVSLGMVAYAAWAMSAGPLTRVFLQIPMGVGSMLIAGGAAIHLWHYRILKAEAGELGMPESLVTSRGLFSRVRHPMYLGDTVMCLGALLAAGDLLALALFAAFGGIIVPLCRDEDRMMKQAFGEKFDRWREKTGAVFPKVR